MSCPDEETFARVQARSLSPVELADFHRHLDNCAACLELAAVLGCLYDGEATPQGESVRESNIGQPAVVERDYLVMPSNKPRRVRARKSHVALLAMTLAQAYFSFSLAPALWWSSGATPTQAFFVEKFGHFGPIATLYLSLWCLVGLVWACAACWALLADRRWTLVAARSYAIMSLPTIVLAPLGLFVIVAFPRTRNYS